MVVPSDSADVRQPSIVMMDPTKLLDFPIQHQVFGEENDAAGELLAVDIRAQGVRDPIDVLPPGNAAGLPENTVLDGHRRRDVAIQLGLDLVPVRIRHDLMDASVEEVTQAFLNYNFVRRQLDPVDQAKVLLNIYNTRRYMPLRFSDLRGINELARHLAALLGKDQKTGGRYIRVAMLPEAIHQAVKLGFLRLTVATKIFAIRDEAVREEIVDAVEEGLDAGEKLNDLVNGMLPDRVQAREQRLFTDLESMLARIEECENRYGDRIEGMSQSGSRTDFLERAVHCKAFFDRLVAQLEAIDSDTHDDNVADVDLDDNPFTEQIEMLEDGNE